MNELKELTECEVAEAKEKLNPKKLKKYYTKSYYKNLEKQKENNEKRLRGIK